ncbi:MAG: aspartyl protease family protein, partial [Planctomycetaceae bacterium]
GRIMGRIRSEIDVDGRPCWTLFDSGARYSYITRDAASGLNLQSLPQARHSALGGTRHEVRDVCLVLAEVDGHPLEFQAGVIDEIGTDEDGRTIDVLFGAIAMQLWGIRLDVQNERLDFSHFTTDFLEF